MNAANTVSELVKSLLAEEAKLREGGGKHAIERQHSKGRLTARERIARLLDPQSPWLEIGLWSGWQMYGDWGGAPGAGVVCGIGDVAGRRHMIVANDATVKAGAFFPATAKKVLRAQRIAMQNRLPLIYLVDSAGIFLPLQEDTFPDEDDFGRIFRNNAVISAMGIGQTAAIMGNCVAGGSYLPVLCDKLLMTEGSGLYLAGPALVKSAIGQEVSSEELGGAAMHAEVSGTIDFHEPNDEACIERIRSLAALRPGDGAGKSGGAEDEKHKDFSSPPLPPSPPPASTFSRIEARPPSRPATDLYDLLHVSSRDDYEARSVIECLVDGDSFGEYKRDYGQSIVCGTARLGGFAIGVVANQHHRVRRADGAMQFGGVLYVDSAEKAARFVMNCNQDWLPILFLQDVNGFMVGRDSERAGIIKSGAKLVSAISNSRVPKLTVITGGSFGAGNYAMCGKAFDPRFIFAWPTARLAVMGSDQASNTLFEIVVKSLERQGDNVDANQLKQLKDKVKADYENQTDIRYGAARGWVDAILDPMLTRDALITALEVATRHAADEPYRLGVYQV
jgi:acetyl-CoA carboxylase carboxyltransferase component